MENQPKEQAKSHGFMRTFFIAVLASLVVLGFAVGVVIAYFALTNPEVMRAGPKAAYDVVSGKKEMPTASTITAEQIACAVEKLGQARVDEIKAGASIGPADFALAGSCF